MENSYFKQQITNQKFQGFCSSLEFGILKIGIQGRLVMDLSLQIIAFDKLRQQILEDRWLSFPPACR